MSELEKIIAERENARGNAESLIRCVENYAKKHNVNIEDACEELDVKLEEYENAHELVAAVS